MISIIGGNRNSMVGDCIVSLPFCNYLEKCYPGSLKIGYVDSKCQQLSPLLLNAPNLDGIKISEESDKVSQNDENYFKKFHMVFEPFPSITEENWYNKRNVHEETFRMNTLRGAGRISPLEWNKLTEEEKKPRLNQWFKTEKKGSFITIWSNAGYQNNDPANNKRSPSVQYWKSLIERLIKEKYEIVQLGLPSHNLHPEIINLTDLSLFEAVGFTLGSSICSIGTDSGSSHVLGAYGVNQIVLSTYWRSGHVTNKKALLPINYKNRAIYLWDDQNINMIDQEKVIEGIKILNE